MSLPLGTLQILGLYGSHYLWVTYCYSRVSFYSTTSLRRRYLDPLTHVETLLSMSLPHRANGFLIRHTLRFLPAQMLPALPFSMHSPTYLQDIAVALPLRFGTDVIVTAGRNLLIKVGLIESERRWTGNFSLPNPERWRSPAERVLESVFESESVTESMVLKLLRADTLASRPYERSEVARRLLNLAVNKFWPELTRFLVGTGAPVDQGVSPSSEELKWPPPLEAFTYVFPSESLSYLPVSYFDRRPVLSHMDRFDLEYPRSISTFMQLVESRRFLDLATSKSEDDWADCQRMMTRAR
jgi:hypothetical protein